MTFLRTVTGDIGASDAGICYAHEHIIIGPSFTTHCYPDFLLDSVEKACVDIAEFRLAGGQTLIDSMPCGGGRNARKLAEISRRTGAYIVCPTGLHLPKYYSSGHWGQKLNAEKLAQLFIADIQEGIDTNDYDGPNIDRGPERAGVIKIATGQATPSPHEQKIFEAAAIAHRETGSPILTHTEQGEGAIEQATLLESLGVDPGHVVLSHTDRKPDVSYHREVLSMGVLLEYDSSFRWPTDSPDGNPTLRLVVELLAAGFGSQLLLGMDAARQKYWHGYGGKPGIAFLLREFVPQLRAAGCTAEDIRKIFVENPARCYAFAAQPRR
jgi:phosphotriesterase-related protein